MQTESDLTKLLARYCQSINQFFRSDMYSGVMDDWKKASLELHKCTIINNLDVIFPLSLNEQVDFITKEYSSWGLPPVEILDGINEPFLLKLDNRYFLSDVAKDLANIEYEENPGATIVKDLKEIIQNIGYNLKLYSTFREFLIRYPIISTRDLPIIRDELDRLVADPLPLYLGIKFNKTDIMDIYLDNYRPLEYHEMKDQRLELCPYCGYPLQKTIKKGYGTKTMVFYQCIKNSCLQRASIDNIKVLELKMNMDYWIVTDQVHSSVVQPGIIEIDIYDKLKKRLNGNAEVELYPESDKADILIRFKDGEEWAADIKDWANPNMLAAKLNSSIFLNGLNEDIRRNITNGFLVVPDDSNMAYINSLKDKWRQANQFEIIKAKDFISMAVKRCSNED